MAAARVHRDPGRRLSGCYNLRRTIRSMNVAMSDTRGDLRFYYLDLDGRLVTGGGHTVWVNARAKRSDARSCAEPSRRWRRSPSISAVTAGST